MVSNYIKQDSLSIDGFRSICITIVFNDDDDDDGHADDDGDNDGLVFPIGWPGGNIAPELAADTDARKENFQIVITITIIIIIILVFIKPI